MARSVVSRDQSRHRIQQNPLDDAVERDGSCIGAEQLWRILESRLCRTRASYVSDRQSDTSSNLAARQHADASLTSGADRAG